MKGMVIVSLLTLIGLSVKSQTVRKIGATGYDAVHDGIVDRRGNLYVTGEYQGIVDFGNGHSDTSVNASIDYFAAKYDKNGNCQWVSTFGTDKVEYGIRIYAGDDGFLYSTIKFGDLFNNVPTWGFGQIDSNGRQTWNCLLTGGQFVPVFSDVKISGSSIELLILPMNTTGFSLASYNGSGTLLGTKSFSVPFNSNGSGSLIHVALQKSDGEVISSKIIKYPNVYLTDAKFTGDNIIVAGGYTGSAQLGVFTLSAHLGLTDSDGLLAEIDTGGLCSWAKSYSLSTNVLTDMLTSICIDGSRVYFLNSTETGWGAYASYYDSQQDTTVFGTHLLESSSVFKLYSDQKSLLRSNVLFRSIVSHSIGGDLSTSMMAFTHDIRTLKLDTVISLPLNAQISSFTADSFSVYATGSFTSTVNFEGTTLTTTPATVEDGFIFRKPFCSFPTPAPTISGTGSILTSSAQMDNQWYLNGSIIPGATMQTYTALTVGTYTVAVSSPYSCSAMSDGYEFPATGLMDLPTNGVLIFPNPTNGKFLLAFNRRAEEDICIYSSIGEKVYQGTADATEIDLSYLPKGIYFIFVDMEGKSSASKIILY
ncbi:MAG: T9SS type A sorting domain-containing protein [Bacteroidia bacterium]|nr:T9SS type A sorting domain-containing protein [Bacteroidia bacterium]